MQRLPRGPTAAVLAPGRQPATCARCGGNELSEVMLSGVGTKMERTTVGVHYAGGWKTRSLASPTARASMDKDGATVLLPP